jgi:zinc protease
LVLHDWSSFIALKDEQIDEERLVIKEEWRTRSGAQYRIWDKQLPVIFKGSKYADRMPIGKMEVVENFPYQTLKDYYHKWYRPDLQGIIIVGDIDVDQVEAKIKTMFADIAKPVNPAERVYFPVPDNNEPIVSIITDPEAVRTQVTLYIKHDIVPAEAKQSQMGLIISYIKALSSRMLSDRLNEISQKADAPFAASYAYDGGFFVSKTKDAWTTIALSKEGKIDETLASLIRENERIKRFGFTDAEVERAKATLLDEYEKMYNNRNKELNNRYVQEYVRSFTEDEAIPGIEYEYNFFKQFSPMINAQAINGAVQQLLGNKNIVITVTGPEKEGITYPTVDELLNVFNTVEAENITAYEETVSNEPLITQLPKAGSVVKTETDDKFGTTIWTLSNGMKVVIKKTNFKDDEILMSSHAYGGTSIIADADINNANMASMVPSVGGIGNFSSTDLKKALAGKSANVNNHISSYVQGLNGSSSIKDLETLLQLTYLYFTAPRKDEGAYSNIMELIKNQLKNLTSEPSFIMNINRTKAMYGDNPRMQVMMLEDAEKLNYDRIIEIYKEIYANPGSFVFNFVGTVDEAALKPLVEQYLASLPSGNKDAKYKDVDASIRKGHIDNIFEQEMKTPKTSAFEMYSGTLKYDQKTQITLSALKQILDIVYVRTVREEAGGTYGVGVRAGISRIPEGQTMGITAEYAFNPYLSADLSLTNGEGYKKIKKDNSMRYAAGISLYPIKNTIFRIYADIYNDDEKQRDALPEGVTDGNYKDQYTLSLFAGYQNEKISFGAEYNKVYNKGFIEKKDYYGYSFYTSAKLASKCRTFARYDLTDSSNPSAFTSPWNDLDGQLMMVGVEFQPVKQLKIAPNFRNINKDRAKAEQYLFINVEFNL